MRFLSVHDWCRLPAIFLRGFGYCRSVRKKIAGGDPATNLWHSFVVGTLVLRHQTRCFVTRFCSPFPRALCVICLLSCRVKKTV
jgi:hypothetical protein